MQLGELVDDPNSHFSNDELVNVGRKFDELYARFELLSDEYHLTKQQLEAMQREFDEVKDIAKTYPKGIWAKVTNNKVVDIVSELFKSKEGRQFILEELKKVISGG